MNNKVPLSVWVGALVVALVIAGGYVFPRAQMSVSSQSLGSSSGSTFGTMKTAMVNIDLTSGTSSSALVNTDASDRVITNATVWCSSVGTSQTAYTGAGLIALILNMGTSTATSGVFTNNKFFSSQVSTSSPWLYVASTTPGATGVAVNRVWNTGTVLNVWSNATNTAQCTLGLDYKAS